MRRIDWKTILLICAVAAAVCFVFRNSMQIGAASHRWSAAVRNLLAQLPFLHWISESLLRKLAHVAEYAAAGMLLFLLGRRLPKNRRLRQGYLLLCAAIPCADELIQKFTPNRKSCFSDVCIDWLGMLLGAVTVWLLLWLWRKNKKAGTRS